MSTAGEGHAAASDAGVGMPLGEAMRTQRSVRRLAAAPVDDEVLLRILSLALRAPSGGNRQPQRFIIVRDRHVKARLARRNRQAWAILRRLSALRARDPRSQRMLASVQWQADHFAEAPVIIVVCSEGWLPPWPPISASTYYGSIYPSVQNLLLAARAEGLGAGLVTLPLWSTVLTRRALGIPWHLQPVCAVPLGWPHASQPYGESTRRPVAEVVHVDRWGHRPFL